MGTQLKSEQLIQVPRPRFAIDGKPAPKLGEDLQKLEATEDEEGMARLEVILLNWGRRTEDSEPGYIYFDAEALDLGREITVEAGAEDNQDIIFQGIITSIEGVYPELRPPELIVRAEDRLQWQRMRQRTRFFEELPDTDMVREVAADNGLACDAEAEGPTHKEFWQVNQSDLGFLRERARAVDARLAVQNGRLVFRPRRESEDPPVKLTLENELLRFQVAADLAHQRVEVHVHGYSVADKEPIHERAGPEAARSEAAGAGRVGPEVLEAIEPDAVEHLHVESPATAEEARLLARAQMRRRARRFVCGRGVTSGTPGMHVGTEVDIVDLGDWFSGVYHVSHVRHTYDQTEGLRTHFLAERVDLGGRS
jgi:phage protein D